MSLIKKLLNKFKETRLDFFLAGIVVALLVLAGEYVWAAVLFIVYPPYAVFWEWVFEKWFDGDKE